MAISRVARVCYNGVPRQWWNTPGRGGRMSTTAPADISITPTSLPDAAINNPSLLRRFFCKVDMETDGCWEWRGSTRTTGYGSMSAAAPGGSRKDRRYISAHRLSFEFFNGPIPDGHEVCHRCDNPLCVNP